MAQTTESVVDLLRGASHDLEHRQRQGATRPAERGGVAVHDLELSTVVDPSTASRDACGKTPHCTRTAIIASDSTIR